MLGEERFFKPNVPTAEKSADQKSEIELNSFGLSDKLLGAANVPAAQAVVKRLEEENTNLEKSGEAAINELNFSNEEFTQLFEKYHAMHGPDEKITLRGTDMRSLGDKRLKDVNPNEKIEQMHNRLNAFKNNFYPEFRARFSNEQALLDLAASKGSKLKEYVEAYRQNSDAVGQYEHFEGDVLERLAKGEAPQEVVFELLQSAIERDNFDWAKRDLLLAYNLKAISDSDLEAAFQKYGEENIKNMDPSKPAYQLTHDYRQEALQKLHYNVLRTTLKENF